MARTLSLKSGLTIAAEIWGAPVEAIGCDQVQEAMALVLDTPVARVPGKERESYPGLANKVAALIWQALARPVLERDNAKLAYRLAQEFCRINGARWTLEARVSVLAIEQIASSDLEDIWDWAPEHVEQPAPASPATSTPRRRQQSLIGPSVEEVRIMLSGRLSELSAPEHRRVRWIGARLSQALAGVDWHDGRPIDVSVLHPSIELSPQREHGLSDRDLWERISSEVLRCHGLIITDIARRTPGCGSGMEYDLAASAGIPILHLHNSSAGRACPFMNGRRHEVDVEVVAYKDERRVAPLAVKWVRRRLDSLLDVERLREDEQLLFGPLQRRLAARWNGLAHEQRLGALALARIKPALLTRALEDISVLASLPERKLARICRALNVARDDAYQPEFSGVHPSDQSVNFEALAVAASDEGWSAETFKMVVDHLFDVVLPSAGQALRGRLQKPGDFIRLARDLHR
jgi:hypothetical protein